MSDPENHDAVKRDPAKWVALIIAIISLGVSGTSAYIQFVPRHDFRATITGLEVRGNSVVISLLLVNRGNQMEALDTAAVEVPHPHDEAQECIVGSSPPSVVKPGEANIVEIHFRLPHQRIDGFDSLTSGVETFDLGFTVADPHPRAGGSFGESTFRRALGIAEDEDGRPEKGREGEFRALKWANLYNENPKSGSYFDCRGGS